MMHNAGSMARLKRCEDVSSRFYVPKMIEWCGMDTNMYCTTNDLEGGKQRTVHRVWLPIMSKQGIVYKIKMIMRMWNKLWKLNPRVLRHLISLPRLIMFYYKHIDMSE